MEDAVPNSTKLHTSKARGGGEKSGPDPEIEVDRVGSQDEEDAPSGLEDDDDDDDEDEDYDANEDADAAAQAEALATGSRRLKAKSGGPATPRERPTKSKDSPRAAQQSSESVAKQATGAAPRPATGASPKAATGLVTAETPERAGAQVQMF